MPDQPSSFTIIGDPVGKPRMTQKDKWEKRPRVEKYRSWADTAREAATGNPQGRIKGNIFGILAIAHLDIPQSYSKKKRSAIYGTLHVEKPDTDNILKSLCDALFEEDKAIAWQQCIKLWITEGEEPRIDVFLIRQSTV